jgi:hypothetical protein
VLFPYNDPKCRSAEEGSLRFRVELTYLTQNYYGLHYVLFEKAVLRITPVDCIVLATQDLFTYIICVFVYFAI